MKKLIFLIILISILCTSASCTQIYETLTVKTTAETTTEIITSPPITTDSIKFENITFIPTKLNTIYQVWKQNRARAEKEYIDQYVCITGTVYSIYSEKYFSLYEFHYNSLGQTTGFDPSNCTLINDEYADILLTLNAYDVITIKGKITELDSLGDFEPQIEVYTIEIE